MIESLEQDCLGTSSGEREGEAGAWGRWRVGGGGGGGREKDGRTDRLTDGRVDRNNERERRAEDKYRDSR